MQYKFYYLNKDVKRVNFRRLRVLVKLSGELN
jgi:hypothetical protein